jgi:hypothetical protein
MTVTASQIRGTTKYCAAEALGGRKKPSTDRCHHSTRLLSLTKATLEYPHFTRHPSVPKRKERTMFNQPENENQQSVTPEEVRQSLLAELDASKQAIEELSDEQLEEVDGGVGSLYQHFRFIRKTGEPSVTLTPNFINRLGKVARK